MKKIFSLLLAASVSISAFAQLEAQQETTEQLQETAETAANTEVPKEKYWQHTGLAGANVSQASYSNWSAGGDASIAFDLLFNFDLNYKKGSHLWTNRLELAYGINNTQSNGMRKTNDKIYFSSNYGYSTIKNLYVGAMVTFQSQFAKGFDYKETPDPDRSTQYISRFMAPGYLTAGIGIIWTPLDWFKLTYAPASWRGTFVHDSMLSDGGNFGVTPGNTVLHQVGSDLVLEVNKRFWEKFTVYSRLELYSNYLKNPQNIIIHWDTQLSANITKWLSASLNVNVIYDDNIKTKLADGTLTGPRLQVKEVLGIGLQATF